LAPLRAGGAGDASGAAPPAPALRPSARSPRLRDVRRAARELAADFVDVGGTGIVVASLFPHVVISKPTLRRPCSLRRGVRRRPVCPREGGGAPTGAECGTAAPRGPPCGRADLGFARDHRPMTPAGAPLGAPPVAIFGLGTVLP